MTFGDLVDGEYTLDIRAVDAAGNTGPMTSRSFTVDTVAPVSRVVGANSGTVVGSSVSFQFVTDDEAAGTELQCRLLAQGDTTTQFAPCTSGQASYGALADGTYTFEVRAVDAAGNVGPVVRRSFVVNVGRPTITAKLSSAKAPTSSGWYRTPVTIEYTCDGAGSALVAPCPAPEVVRRGSTNRAVTRTIGTVDGDTATVTVTVSVDRRKPKVSATGFSTKRTYSQRPAVGCRARDRRSGVRSCTARVFISKDRRWVVVRLRATDVAGNVRAKTLRAPFDPARRTR
ncbi:Ig-like domain repeat protein [Nocardioides hwasunensis]|uniref:Ig-like domain repeat protein n=1 Tax=Nocardioides hwasunensis TaxID=397258 RepID=A0ABR8MNY2_9ACTN|nr:Ig-like domain repeat protein [Nocardioides hwasunensis]